eukprot:11196235-Lingulodinium_polyedra.AAC.1
MCAATFDVVACGRRAVAVAQEFCSLPPAFARPSVLDDVRASIGEAPFVGAEIAVRQSRGQRSRRAPCSTRPGPSAEWRG